MTAITVSQTDRQIIEDIQAALAAATVDGQGAFASVTASASDRQARECQFRDSPAAIVRLIERSARPAPSEQLGRVLRLELLLAGRAAEGGVDESDRLAEGLRLAAAAEAAVRANPPEAAAGWSDGDTAVAALAFGPPTIEPQPDRPWVLARLELRVAYLADAATGAPPASPPYQVFRDVDELQLAGTAVEGVLAVELHRERIGWADSGDAELHATAVAAGACVVSGRITTLDVAQANALAALGGTLTFLWRDSAAGGTDRTVTVANVTVTDVCQDVARGKASRGIARFRAASPDGVTDPVSVT